MCVRCIRRFGGLFIQVCNKREIFMKNGEKEAAAQQTEPVRRGGRSGRRFRAAAGIVLAVLLAAYLGLCVYAVNCKTIWRGTQVLGQDVGGLTVSQAAEKIETALPNLSINVYLYNSDGQPSDPSGTPDAVIAASDLGASVDGRAAAQAAYDYHAKNGLLITAGWRYLTNPGLVQGAAHVMSVDAAKTQSAASSTAQSLSRTAQDTAWQLGTDSLAVTTARDGRDVRAEDVEQPLADLSWASDLTIQVPYTAKTAKSLSAQDLHDLLANSMKNAGYDPATQSITAEQAGVDFDVDAAQKLLKDAKDGAQVTIPATIQQPRVTAEQLKAVLFRDVLGSATTHVGGTSARISNVKLASSSVNGTVLNSGDTFSYNTTVGKRTEAKGYQAAPAYVQGETVDEIGGGVCQPSSTLYLACLRSNLEIVQRAAHRYVPAYIAKGMDATVSWGGPDYQFRNNTDYPIRISAVYSKGYLTMTLYGTRADDTYVKMTNKVLSTTNFTVVYQDDGTLAPGTQKVKVTPYTGYKVESYRNLYSGDGSLISSRLEAVSDYKVRNELILVGPKAASVPASGSASASGETPAATPGGTAEPTNPGTTDPAAPETPGAGTTAPETPDTGAEGTPGTETAEETPDGAL